MFSKTREKIVKKDTLPCMAMVFQVFFRCFSRAEVKLCDRDINHHNRSRCQKRCSVVFFAFPTSFVPGLASGTNASGRLWGKGKKRPGKRQMKLEAAGRDGYICISFCIRENNHNPLIER